MRFFINITIACSMLLSLACKSTADKASANINASGSTVISGQVNNCQTDSIYFFGLNGIMLERISATPVISGDNGQSTFSFDAGELNTGFYFIGPAPNNVRIMAINHDAEVKLEGSCTEFKSAQITTGATHQQFEAVTKELETTMQAFNSNIQRYRSTIQRQGDLEPIISDMVALDKQKIALLDSLKQSNSFLATYAGVRTYISYQHYERTTEQLLYNNEPNYFADNYFKMVDLADPVLNNIPYLHDAFKSYAQTLTQLGFSAEDQKSFAQNQLAQVTKGSSAYKMALLGMTQGFKGKNMAAYVDLADQYFATFPEENNQLIAQMKKEVAGARSRVAGATAPEIDLPTPEGAKLKLSDLRGKIVLIDFWASWCGPCRRENPNVVKVYEKYKDKGFEILSVSLDRDKNRWLKAIEQDGLDWLHVSDLKQWRSVAAQTYGVSSIPYTVLVDREGKIIASRLRGAALENKLAEIFGS